MGSISPIHWVIVAVVLIMLFGPKTLSKVGRTAGRTVRTAAKVKQSLDDVPSRVIGDLPRPGSSSKPPS